MSKREAATTCLVCSETMSRAFRRGPYEYLRCPSCYLLTTLPLPTQKAIQAHYRRGFAEGNYHLAHRYSEALESVHLTFVDVLTQRFQRAGESVTGKRLLDIGCFTGEFLCLARAAGFDPYGFELQHEAVELANHRLPGRVSATDVLNSNLPGDQYDVVSLLGVIEHVLEPRALLRKSVELLRPGGLLLIQTPNSGSRTARISGSHWPPCAPVEHIHLFSAKSLSLLLTELGITNLQTKRHWKWLPLSYVHEMLLHFGPEYRKLLGPAYRLLPRRVRDRAFPFYAGELILCGSRRAGGAQR